MKKSQKIVQAFRSKFDAMSPEEREQYLNKMGLKYEKSDCSVEMLSTEEKPFPIDQDGFIFGSIPKGTKIQHVNGKFFYIKPNGERVAIKSAKRRLPAKKA